MEAALTAGVPVALYARVSTEEQREGQTIDSQVAELERFARAQGWQLAEAYKDEGWSGGILARPALDRLRDDAAKGLYRAVLINDVDRLARDVTHLGILKRDLERHAVRVIFRKLPTESSPTQNLMINVLGSFAEFERELIADRTRRGRRHKVEVRRQFLGCLAPYGFRYVAKNRSTGEDGQLQVDAFEAAIVRDMFAWVDREGLSALQVVRRLTARSIPTRKGGSAWAKSSVLRILRSETYAGVWHYYKHENCVPRQPRRSGPYRKSIKSSLRLRSRGDWVPLPLPMQLHIVPRDQWERVQQQLDRNRFFSPRNSRHTYLLKALVRCGACGGRYVGCPSHGLFTYRCVQRCKRLPSISERRLDTAVWQAVTEAILNPALIIEQVERLRQVREAEATARAQEAQQCSHALEQLAAEEARVVEAYRLNILSADQLKRELGTLEQRRRALGRVPEGPKTTLPPNVETAVTDYCAVAATRLQTLTTQERQRVLQLLIREIVFEGAHVRVRAVITLVDAAGAGSGPREPIDEGSCAHTATTTPYSHGRNLTDRGDIATTTPYGRSRNLTISGGVAPMEPLDCGLNDVAQNARSQEIPFELTCPLPPIEYVRNRNALGRFASSSQTVA